MSFFALQPLSLENHRSKLDTLLFVEEIEMEEEMRQFDMEKVLSLAFYHSFTFSL